MQPVATPTPKPQFGNIIEPPLLLLRTLSVSSENFALGSENFASGSENFALGSENFALSIFLRK